MADITVQIVAAMTQVQNRVDRNMQEIAMQVAKDCARDLNAASSIFKTTGRHKVPYAKSWTCRKDGTCVTVYSKIAGLPHLLEHGHAVVHKGAVVGRAEGRVHIKPVADQYRDEFERRAKEAAG